MTILLIALAINLVISLMISSSVKSREVSASKVFWISFLLTPLLGMFVALMSRQLSPEEAEKKEERAKKERKTSLMIVGFIGVGITILTSYYFITSPSKEQIEKEKSDIMEKIRKNQISDFESSGRDTTREFRGYFSDYHALSPSEKEEFVNHKRIPKEISESRFQNMKYEIISNICNEELPQYIKKMRIRRDTL